MSRRHNRSGSIYTITVGCCLIVTVLGYSALTLVRVQRQTVTSNNRASLATRAALSGLQMAFYRIKTESNWRTKLRNGQWDSDQSTDWWDSGMLRFTGVDPIDNDLLDSDVDPVVITATGKSGDAVQIKTATIEFRREGIRCLESSLHANGVLTINGSTVRSDNIISSNSAIEALNGAQVHAPAEAARSVSNDFTSIYHRGTSTSGTWPRDMPNVSKVLDAYPSATLINFRDLPNNNVLSNPGKEDGTTNWPPLISCNVIDTGNANTGQKALWVTNRSSTLDGPCQEVSAHLVNGQTYYVETWIRRWHLEENCRLMLRITDGKGTYDVPMTNWVKCPQSSYGKISGSQTVTFTAPLGSAKLFVETQASTLPYAMDDTYLCSGTAPLHYLEKVVLSPGSNPYGRSNDKGLYRINCEGPLVVRDMRCAGTLLITNPSPLTIEGAVHLQPAQASWDVSGENYPALIVSGNATIKTDGNDLSEATHSVNFNSAGSPYLGSQDSDITDLYPNRIHGLVYVSGDLAFENQPCIRGAVIAGGNIGVTSGELTVTYDPTYLKQNAAPGFVSGIVPKFTRGSFKRATN